MPCNQQLWRITAKSVTQKIRTFIHFRTMPAGRRTRLQKGGHVLLLPDVWFKSFAVSCGRVNFVQAGGDKALYVCDVIHEHKPK